MKIAVNTRFLLKDKMEGIGWFTYETMKRIVETHPEDEFHFLFDRPYDKSFIWSKNIIPHVVYPPARHPILWKIWFEYSVPRVLRKIKPDLFYSPDGYNSLKSPFRSVMTIHDLAFEYYPEFVDPSVARYYKRNTPKYAHKADRVIVVSENTKADVVKLYDVNEEKIDVSCNGCREIFRPLGADKRSEIREKFSGGDPYFIFIGAIHPRKNVEGILKAFELFKAEKKHNHRLMLVGRMAWQTSELSRLLNSLNSRDSIIHIPHIGEEISDLLGSAQALLYPSFYEGFGIPVLEAFHSEIPVITSNVSSMPEVAGNAAIFVDPNSPENIKAAMERIVLDRELGERLIHEGRNQRKNYSWDKGARIIYESFERVISSQ